ncbi:MAG: type II toxin-antitoxin system death-on-curing family toxin [Planctomycetota bacterium]
MQPEDPAYLSEQEIVEVHRWVIGRIGGKTGIRDRNALESCVAQPKTAVFGTERFATVFEKAAAYCYYIIRLHPFLDGNKRTGLTDAIVFLLDNGWRPSFDEDEMYRTITHVATGDVDIDELASVFEEACTK